MSLPELIAGVEAHEKTLTVFNAAPGVAGTFREQFSDRNVVVRDANTPAGPEAYVVLSADDQFITAAPVDTVLGHSPAGADREAASDRPDRPILDELDETLFTSYDAEQMFAASREIEDRAWRNGRGTLYAGFQRLSVLEGQLEVYDRLATRQELSVHAYAYPDIEVPSHDAVTVHVERAEEIQNTWFVAYDGAGDDDTKCALLAEEREPRSFYGFWTYDPDTVDWIVDHLTNTYGLVERV